MNISEEQTIITTMTMPTITIIMKTKNMAGTNIIKYQKIIQLVMHHMIIVMSIMATLRITIKMIITPLEAGIIIQKMRNMKMIMLINLEVMVKM